MNKKEQFNDLFKKHYPKVFRLCKGYFDGDDALAADCAQDIFLKIWASLDSFRGESNMGTWIYRISVNTALLYLRKQSASKEKAAADFALLSADQDAGETEYKLKRMYACIQKLRERERLITLMMLEGVGYPQIAEVVGVTEETLRVQIHRIKKNLTQCVQHGNI